jgi:hypothetical protein
MNLNITLTGLGKTLDGKKYKEEVKAKLDSIANDLNLIELEEFRDEILLEYNQNLDFAKSKLIVVNRHKQMEELKKQQEEKKKQEQQEQLIEEAIDKVIEEQIIAPIEIPTAEIGEEIIEVTFTVKGNKTQLRNLKQFLNAEGLEWE